MSPRAGRARLALLIAASLVASSTGAPAAGGAQSITERVAGVRNGTVWMSFASAPGVCGNGRGSISIRQGPRLEYFGSGDIAEKEWKDPCEDGPVRISLDVRGGSVVMLRSYVGGEWRGTPTLDLGKVTPAAASGFLLGLAERGSDKPARDAIFPASIASDVVTWPRLLKLAKDDTRPREVREGAVFWVARAAGEAATRGLQEMVDDPAGDREVRKSAIFALSQRPGDEAVPALLRIARTHQDPELRRTAIFWLGQSKDPRALRYFEEVLTKGR